MRVIARKPVAGASQLQRDRSDQQHTDEQMHRDQLMDPHDRQPVDVSDRSALLLGAALLGVIVALAGAPRLPGSRMTALPVSSHRVVAGSARGRSASGRPSR